MASTAAKPMPARGSTPDAGARAAASGVTGRAALDAHDAYGFFAAAGALLETGPTRTNVNDFRVILTL